jgi:hypothetical protein
MAKQSFTIGQVLTAAQMTSLQQTAMLGGAASAKTASYTLVAADAGSAISMSNAGATTITVNTALFAAGDTVHITNLGAGVCTITAGTATVNSSASLALAQYESGFLDFTSTSAAIFVKGAGAAASSGGMTLISETVASALSSLSFSSISGSYKQLLLVWSGIRHSGIGGKYDIRLNNNSGSVYAVQMSPSIGTSLATQSELRTSIGDGTVRAFGDSANGGELRLDVSGYFTIDNYASTTKAKTFYGSHNYFDNNAGSFQAANSYTGTFNSTTAVTSIDIVQIAGSATFSNTGDTTIRLYGVA